MTEEMGPAVGTEVADFSLPDENKLARSLKDTMGKQGVLIATIHGTWCPSCVNTLRSLTQKAAIYGKHGVKVAAISTDDPDTSYTFKLSSAKLIPFPILSDEQNKLQEAYHLGHTQAFLYIDPENMLRAKFLDTEHKGWAGHKRLLGIIGDETNS